MEGMGAIMIVQSATPSPTNHSHHNSAMNHGTSIALSAGKHAGHSAAMFFRKFLVSLALTIPVLFYGGWVFLAGAWREMRTRLPGMMTLIGMAISAAYLWSIYAAIAHEEALFWELTTLITIMLLGHWIEMRAVSGAQGALKELSKLLPDTAEVVRDG